jgi:hypothetical protein
MRDVLAAVVDAPAGDPTWGFRICETTGRGPGGVYPALDRLMKAGLITDEWEDPPPADRPRRRLYHAVPGAYGYLLPDHLLPGMSQ